MFLLIKEHKYLLKELIKKDIISKYQGSIFGIIWSFLIPLINLAIYTIVFSEIFEAKWGAEVDNKFGFALSLFCGLILYNLFAEVLGRSVGLIAGNVNYVKKVVFPIELLPLVVVFSALFNCVTSYLIMILGTLVLTGTLPITIWQGVIVLVPHLIYCTALAYLLSAISVYIKDLVNVISVILLMGMYVSPIFFSLDSVPESLRFVMFLNPMTYIIENMRNVMLYGVNMNLTYFTISIIVSLILYFIGRTIFNRAKEGFSELL